LCRAFGVAYVTVEASWSARRNAGIWVDTQSMALAAVRHAAVNLYLTARDAAGLRLAAPAALLAMLPPFIDTAPFDAAPRPEPGHIVTVAMMRAGDKMDSYALLARALTLLPADLDWRLSVAGDGPERLAVQAHFARLPAARIVWLGALSPVAVAGLLARGQVYVWPGCGEAYGLAYLEAQAAGLPVVACDTAGVSEAVNSTAGNLLVPSGDAAAIATGLTGLLRDPARAAARGAQARDHVRARHSIGAATAHLAGIIEAVYARHAAPVEKSPS
jgi:glycosyltransferase involved in cell wall biosynthesis